MWIAERKPKIKALKKEGREPLPASRDWGYSELWPLVRGHSQSAATGSEKVRVLNPWPQFPPFFHCVVDVYCLSLALPTQGRRGKEDGRHT